MKRRFLLLLVLLCSSHLPVRAAGPVNCVLYWNNEVVNATRLSRNPPPLAAVFFAAYHAAIFDTVNGIDHKYHGWCMDGPAPAGANVDAAVASAAHTVLLAYWSQSANPRVFELAYEKSLAAIPDGPDKEAGVAWGKKCAEAVIAARADSGFDKPIPGKYSSNEVGKWRETPSGFRPPVLPYFAQVKPFTMTSCSQFRCPPPYAADSDQAAEELAFVARVGPRDGAERTEYQTLSTPFWSDDLGTSTPPGHWNVVAEDLAERKHLSVLETARLFALLNFAEADAGISCWETKYFYRTWRPETALRELDPKANPKFVSKPDFIPNMPSPAFPSYSSGHSTFSAAATRLLERYFGTDDIEFSVKSDGLPGAVRTFKKLSDARREVGMSRVWGGIHTMADNLEAQKAGIKIGDWVYDTAIKPL